MEEAETTKVFMQSEELLKTLIKATTAKLQHLEKLNPNDVQTRVKFKEIERQAIGIQKQIKEVLTGL